MAILNRIHVNKYANNNNKPVNIEIKATCNHLSGYEIAFSC